MTSPTPNPERLSLGSGSSVGAPLRAAPLSHCVVLRRTSNPEQFGASGTHATLACGPRRAAMGGSVTEPRSLSEWGSEGDPSPPSSRQEPVSLSA